MKSVDFKKQTNRQKLLNYYPNAHDERFSQINFFPDQYSKYKRTNTPDLSKQVGRETPEVSKINFFDKRSQLNKSSKIEKQESPTKLLCRIRRMKSVGSVHRYKNLDYL